MDDRDFQIQADRSLHALNRRLSDASNDYPFEADFIGGALVVEFEDDNGKFVVSPNSPVQQIWISALSKSFKLEWDAERNEFALPSSGQSLDELLLSLIEQHLGQKVDL